ncbi:DUF881 domain-containing protein [Bacillus horti]|uniref:Uncharacterized protein YlxW (UPF0749 family) n=1 Tax=Caldalkalibacillus horti TaxID=77523 RepID=A0ABT9VUE7_9BACI|nr:DUF881 domain-containing protein [Bacillus horti]MDQ0164611.1 uncharacterized protein YlxW (UPF0749 family) [Bacillus horti]
MNKRVPLLLAFICVILGFMVAIQFQSNNETEYSDSRDMNELRINLQKERERTQILLNEISKHEHLLYQYEMSMNKEDELTSVMEQELQRIKKMAGMDDVIGEGVIVRIKKSEDMDLENDFYTQLVFDEDLRKIVNDVNAYGARAISINGQRIISTSAVRNVGNRILVNTIPIQPPYEIRVIGDPSILIPALRLEGLDEYFAVVNHVVEYEEKSSLTIKGYSQDIENYYLQSVKEDN